MADARVGTGFDAHALEPGVPLVLGGLSFRSERGLAGHSDGDVIAHALIDAIVGPVGLGDIGTLFPSEDPELRGVSSLKLLREAYVQVRSAGWKLVNADVVFIGSEPRIGPVRREMEALLASALDGDGVVTVRATTTDGLGFTGRGEGLAAQAVALLERAP
ncbi:MAG: 2-C-methyl-D-erythritol 2,4-cyclodiphosphate synthase [Gaiellaceae bacterium]